MKTVFRSKRIPAPGSNYSPGFNVNNLLFISGLLATDYKIGVPDIAKGHPKFPWFGDETKMQADYTLNNLKILMEDAGSSLDNILKTSVYMLDLKEYQKFNEVYEKFFPKNKPPQTIVEVKREGCYWGQGLLGSIGDLFEIEVIAAASNRGVDKRVIPTGNLPVPLDNHSLATASGDFVFTTGLLATDYKTGIPREAIVDPSLILFGSEIKLQTRYILNQLKTLLKNAGTSLENIVKANVYLLDLKDYFQFNEVWEEFFPKNGPARTVTKMEGLLGAKGDRVQIEAIAVVSSSKTKKEIVTTEKVSKPSKSHTLATKAGGILFTSGIVATDYKTGIPAEAKTDPVFPLFGSDVKRQVAYSLENLKMLVEESGCSMKDVAKCNMYLTDLRDYHEFTEVLPKFFPEVDPPSRTVFQVDQILGPLGTRFEIEVIATID